MLKWQDNLSQDSENKLAALADALREIKSKGWSVVFSENEVIVRPKDRSVGKFSITSVKEGQFVTSFFSRELNIWNKRADFADIPSAAVSIRDWIESAVVDPKKRVAR